MDIKNVTRPAMTPAQCDVTWKLWAEVAEVQEALRGVLKKFYDLAGDHHQVNDWESPFIRWIDKNADRIDTALSILTPDEESF